MKTTEITRIAPEHRVLDKGKYNAYVNFCPFCYPERVWLDTLHAIGFSTDEQGYVVEVSECPKCFEKSYHHLFDFGSYELWKLMKKLENE